ncbi:MAG TPA: tetratricopeptide repeat protein [Anaerolineaceae bacterium]|nr:tetratricopeptide repeat protein [Anaerolineaceae bacterium]
MTPEFIVDVNETNFEYEVLSYSENVPVVVDFWASWCKPCKVLGPLLERLATEMQGSFRLARVDVDANPNLALRFGIRSLPAVVAFSQGEVQSQFSGAQPEERVREFIAQITPPSPANLMLEKANSLAADQDWRAAEALYRELLELRPDDPESLFGLAKSLLGQGQASEAHDLLTAFPASRFYHNARQLLPFAAALMRLHAGSLPDETDLDAAFRNAVRLAGRGNLPAALDGLLDILRQDKRYRDGTARAVFLALLELLGEEHPQTREYRTELASTLF